MEKAPIDINQLIPMMRPGWVAMDEDGTWKYFPHKPDVYKPADDGFVGCTGDWNMDEDEVGAEWLEYENLSGVFNILPFDGDWTDSLIEIKGDA